MLGSGFVQGVPGTWFGLSQTVLWQWHRLELTNLETSTKNSTHNFLLLLAKKLCFKVSVAVAVAVLLCRCRVAGFSA